ncbi:hypothetical protein NKG94_22185 [Micromonospora sp. M12]
MINSPVRSYTEWDLLEEVVVGIVDDATFPPWHPALEPVIPAGQHETFRREQGRPFPPEIVRPRGGNLRSSSGCWRRRASPSAARSRFRSAGRTPRGVDEHRMYAAMPRDALLVVGEEIIECPMAWRSRYYETLAYRPLLKEYFRHGARWSAGPKPELLDELYDLDWSEPAAGEPTSLVVTEFEPTFDAADFLRFGRDIVGQKSNVTNEFGIAWLARHLGDQYRVRILEFDDDHPMHIDATIVPLAPANCWSTRSGSARSRRCSRPGTCCPRRPR